MTSVDASERPDDEVLRAVAGALQDAWNDHDAQRVAEVFTQDAVMQDPGAPEALLQGRSAIRAYIESCASWAQTSVRWPASWITRALVPGAAERPGPTL